MHILDTNFAAVSFFHGVNNFPKSPLSLLTEEATPVRNRDVELLIKISLSETVVFDVQKLCEVLASIHKFGINIITIDLFQLQRIKVSLEVTVCHVGSDET